jgi:hypothetical protein
MSAGLGGSVEIGGVTPSSLYGALRRDELASQTLTV